MSPLPDPTDHEEDSQGSDAEAAVAGSDAWVDAESAASFPASDPPSDWAGADDSPGAESDQEMA